MSRRWAFGWVCMGLLAIITSAAWGQPVLANGRVVGVHDGDSITVLTAGNQRLKVRLEGIDAPELGQPFGQASKQALSALVFGKAVTLSISGLDRYQRTLAVVWAGGLNCNVQMVRLGLAWRYDLSLKDPMLLAAQGMAQFERRGLWAGQGAIPPWLWRKKGSD